MVLTAAVDNHLASAASEKVFGTCYTVSTFRGGSMSEKVRE
jgi:hypothetical protein